MHSNCSRFSTKKGHLAQAATTNFPISGMARNQTQDISYPLQNINNNNNNIIVMLPWTHILGSPSMLINNNVCNELFQHVQKCCVGSNRAVGCIQSVLFASE